MRVREWQRGSGPRPGPEGRADGAPAGGGKFENLIGLDFGGVVIVEGIDDFEVVVMKIGEEVMDFEDEC